MHRQSIFPTHLTPIVTAVFKVVTSVVRFNAVLAVAQDAGADREVHLNVVQEPFDPTTSVVAMDLLPAL